MSDLLWLSHRPLRFLHTRPGERPKETKKTVKTIGARCDVNSPTSMSTTGTRALRTLKAPTRLRERPALSELHTALQQGAPGDCFPPPEASQLSRGWGGRGVHRDKVVSLQSRSSSSGLRNYFLTPPLQTTARFCLLLLIFSHGIFPDP